MHVNNLSNRLNDKKLLGSTTRIRLQNLQNLFWSNEPITESLETFKTGRNQSLINDILNICKANKFTFKLSEGIRKNLIIKGGNFLVRDILVEKSCFSLYRKSLRQRNILFLEQLTSFDG